MMVLGFPVLRVSFGIWVPLQRGLVLVSCAQCFCLLYVSHLILSRVFYFLVSSSLHFWSLFFSHCCGHPLNLLLGGKTLWHLPYLLLVLVVVLVWYLVCCCASREHVPLVWPVCWRTWLALTVFVPCSTDVFLNFLLHCQIYVLIFPRLDHAIPCLLWVNLRYFGWRLWVTLKSSQPCPLVFPSVFGIVWVTACIGMMFCIRQ